MTIVPNDSEGLQLDLRASNQTEKYLDSTAYAETPRSPVYHQPAWNEKTGFFDQPPGTDPSEVWKPPIPASHPAFATRNQDVRFSGNPVDSLSAQVPQRICGLRRRKFWTVLGLGLSFIIIGAIIGGVLAGKRPKSIPAPAPAAAAQPPPPPSAPPSSNSTSSPVTVAPVAPGSSNPYLP